MIALFSKRDRKGLINLYQLAFVTVHNYILINGGQYSEIRPFLIKNLVLFFNEVNNNNFKENQDIVEQFEEKCKLNWKQKNDFYQNDFQQNETFNYLQKNAEPSLRQNIWGKKWTVFSLIIIVLGLLALIFLDN